MISGAKFRPAFAGADIAVCKLGKRAKRSTKLSVYKGSLPWHSAQRWEKVAAGGGGRLLRPQWKEADFADQSHLGSRSAGRSERNRLPTNGGKRSWRPPRFILCSKEILRKLIAYLLGRAIQPSKSLLC